jgi:ABC-type Fe3+ transport system permease subunit
VVGRVAWFTLWQATLSTLLTLAIGLPGAYAFSRLRFRGSALLRASVTVPFVLPTVVVAAAFLALLGPRARSTRRSAGCSARAHRPSTCAGRSPRS